MAGPFAENELCQDFVKNLKAMLAMKRWQPKDLSTETKYAYTTVANILSFNREPSVGNGKAFDDAFGVTVFETKARAIQSGFFPKAFENFPAHEATADDLYIYQHSVSPD